MKKSRVRAVGLAAGVVIWVAFFDQFSQLPLTAPYAQSLGASSALVGLIVAAYSLTNLVGNLVAGYLADTRGRRLPLTVGPLAASVALLLYTLSSTPLHLLLVRSFHGLAVGMVTPAAFTLVADISAQGARGRAMGLAGSLIGLAAVVAPASSGLIRARWGFHPVFFLVAGLFVLAFLMSVALLRVVPMTRLGREGAEEPLALRALLSPCAAAFALMAGLGVLTAHIPLRLEAVGYGKASAGAMFSVFSLVAVAAMASPLSRASDRVGTARPTSAGLILVGMALALLSVPLASAVTWLAMALFGLGFGLVFPASNAAVADAAPGFRRGRAFAVFYAVFSLGAIAGAASSGILVGAAGEAVLPYGLGTLLSLATAIFVARRATKRP